MKLLKIANIILAFVLALSTAFLWITTWQALNESKKATQGSFILELNRDFYLNDRLYGVRKSVESNAPILKENGGRYTTQDIDDYIGFFELMSNLIDRNVIDYKLIDSNFGESIMSAYENKEIMNYIMHQRKDLNEPDLYSGFNDLAKEISKNAPSPQPNKTKAMNKNKKIKKAKTQKTLVKISKTTITQPYKAIIPGEHKGIRGQSPERPIY